MGASKMVMNVNKARVTTGAPVYGHLHLLRHNARLIPICPREFSHDPAIAVRGGAAHRATSRTDADQVI
jgi:hypothetical protein